MNKSIWGMYKSQFEGNFPPRSFSSKAEYMEFLSLPPMVTPSAPGFYRIVLPLDELAKHGWKTDHRFGYPYPPDEDWNLVVSQQADNVKGIELHEDLIKRGNKLIYETDDNIFLALYGLAGLDDRWNREVARLESVNKQQHAEYVETAIKVISMCSMVTVTNQHLADVMADITGHTNVKVLPNYIPAALLELERNVNRRKLVVGWQGGHLHMNDVELINGPVQRFLERHKKAEFHVIGACESKFEYKGVRFTPWIRLDRTYKYYRAFDFDFMLIPLLSNDEFNRSKSAIKAIEAMSLGIPVICSNHEIYQGTVIDGVTGFLVDTEEEFEDKMELLAKDAELRETMGKNAREAAQQYTIEGNWYKWEQAYQELL